LSRPEFVTLMALMTSLIALSIDSMLPAFNAIHRDFRLQTPDQLQMVIAILFLGFGFGQLIFGQLSDIFGRKPPIYWGVAIFAMGSVLAGMTQSFEWFLIGRFLQGFGGAAPRIISLALIRDEYKGNAMAQITSMVMTIFILVPALAPTLGQGVIYFFHWRAIFILLCVVALSLWAWFAIRQHETLPPGLRRGFTAKQLVFGVKETFRQPTTVSCMIVSGILFGIFVGYLGSAQEIFSRIFHMEKLFPLMFGILALSIGGASFFNSRLVMALGMRRLILGAFLWMALISNLFALYLTNYLPSTPPPLMVFMIYMILTFFSVGFLFGNLNALAMEPLGHVAGVGSALIGFVQSTISVAIGIFLGKYYHESILPLVLSFGGASLICIFILSLEKRFHHRMLQD